MGEFNILDNCIAVFGFNASIWIILFFTDDKEDGVAAATAGFSLTFISFFKSSVFVPFLFCGV